MTKPLADHGTYARYTGRPHSQIPGCRCNLCRAAAHRYTKRRDVLTATGRPLTVDATPARQHLTSLIAAGAGWNQIGDAADISSAIISNILGGQREIRRRTELKILALRLDQVLPADRSMPALGAIRRVRALAAIGYSGLTMAAESGVSDSLINGLLAGQYERVYVRTHAAIADMFRRHSMTPDGCRRAINRARTAGWAPPLAWDDDIDDPNAEPIIDPEAPATPIVDEVAVLRLAKGDHSIRFTDPERPLAARQLAAHGLSPWQIAKALHTHGRKVEVWLAEAS